MQWHWRHQQFRAFDAMTFVCCAAFNCVRVLKRHHTLSRCCQTFSQISFSRFPYWVEALRVNKVPPHGDMRLRASKSCPCRKQSTCCLGQRERQKIRKWLKRKNGGGLVSVRTMRKDQQVPAQNLADEKKVTVISEWKNVEDVNWFNLMSTNFRAMQSH